MKAVAVQSLLDRTKLLNVVLWLSSPMLASSGADAYSVLEIVAEEPKLLTLRNKRTDTMLKVYRKANMLMVSSNGADMTYSTKAHKAECPAETGEKCACPLVAVLKKGVPRINRLYLDIIGGRDIARLLK